MATRLVRWSDAAQRDMDDIVDYIAVESPLNAERVLGRLQQQAHSLQMFAERRRRLPELASRKRSERERRANWRELIVRPWRIVYAIDEELVTVLGVVDGRRDLLAWLSRRLAAELSRTSQ